ncbi:MAG: hypothetical protein CL946_11415 [Ectothiorhodospiraceae bacterium]|nr:hypothetical protein [Ectothiorhodospiraceae bacterium]
MTAAKKQARTILERIKSEAEKRRYTIGVIQEKQWSLELAVQDTEYKAKAVVFFNAKGRLTPKVQGKDSPLYRELEDWLDIRGEVESGFLPEGVDAWIGVDESGKGDYFGPLVTAAALITPEVREDIGSLLVRDSKEMGASAITTTAERLREILGDGYAVVTAMPEEYNRMLEDEDYANSQHMLAAQHARVIEMLLERYPEIKYAVCDKFGKEEVIEDALEDRGKSITVIQRTKAESDPAVAAASILARDGFVQAMQGLERKLGYDLPLGASNERAIFNAAEVIIERDGRKALGQYAKLHFRTTQKIYKALFMT